MVFAVLETPYPTTTTSSSDSVEGSKTIYLPPEEITGEFLGEMGSIRAGMVGLLYFYRAKAQVADAG